MSRYLLAVLALTFAAGPAAAQDLVGAWSGARPGQGGMEHITEAYGSDGSFVSVLQLPNGTLQRLWGQYRASPVSPNQVRMTFQVQGFLPRQICAQAPGFPINCRPNEVPMAVAGVIAMTSPNSFQVNGMTMARDGSPTLLQQPVPERLVLAANAPVQPQITQPVMPTLHPYQTPNGPGQSIAGANHQGAQDFINGHLRGCSKAPDGRLYGCEQ